MRLSRILKLALFLVCLKGFGQTAGTIVTVAGSGGAGYDGDNKLATNAQLDTPPFVAVDQAGNIYIADQRNHRIRKVDTSGTITTFAGTGAPGYSGDNQPATSATLNLPIGVFADLSGNVFINDTGNQRIRKVDPNGIITTVAGTGTTGYNGDGIPARSANFWNAVRAVADAGGNLYVADQSNHRIRKIDTSGIVTTIAGSGVGAGGSTPPYNGDGAATSVNLNNPTALALDGAGNLYFSDQFNHRIRLLSGGQVTTIAGTGTAGYNGDGAPLNTNLNYPGSLVVDPSGAIFFTDGPNQRLRKISADRSQITTIAGTGAAGYNGDGIPAATAQLNFAFGLALDGNGNLYIADTLNNRIRKIFGAGAGSGPAPVFSNQQVQNAASFAVGIAPGGLVTVFGAGVTNGVNGSITVASPPLPKELAGVSVTMGGISAPVYSVYNVAGQQQVSVQAPYELAGQTSTPVVVTANGARSAPVNVVVLPAQPGIIAYGANNAVAVRGIDNSLVTATNAAVKGEAVVLYMTGLGVVTPAVPTGAAVATISQTPVTPSVSLGGVTVQPFFSGVTGGYAGLYQINFFVPANAPSGSLDLFVTMSGVQSNTVKLAVQ